MQRHSVAKVQKSAVPVPGLPKQSAGRSPAAHPLLQLQRSVGNQAMQRLIRSHHIQPKLQAGPQVQRTIGDGHDLQSPRFAGDPVLEACFDNERLLRFGSQGSAVSKIQQALVDAGFPLPRFGVDGIFKAETQSAVRDYQLARGLEPDGIVGPITMGSLDAEFAASASAGPIPTLPTLPQPLPAPPGPVPVLPGPIPVPPGPAPGSPLPVPASPGPIPIPPGPGPTVPVTISGGSELWHFDGEAPPLYPLFQNLTASAGGLPGTFTWSIVSGSNIVAFGFFVPLPVAFTPTVTLASIGPSQVRDDAQVSVTFTGIGGVTGTATRNFTVRAPQSLKSRGNIHDPLPRGRDGYDSFIRYTILDQFGTKLPRDVDSNEQWDDKPPIPDFPGTNWPSLLPLKESGNVAPAGELTDKVGVGDSVPPSLIPTPLRPGKTLGAVLVDHFRGHWQVGSRTIGRGRRVATVTWRHFLDHADHL